jgi:signal transduction histidine kinase
MPFDITLLMRDLALNLVTVSILVFALYFLRYHRRDYAIGYIAINISLFVVASTLTASAEFTIGVGFALFAILSIVRLRSDEATWIEIGYTMVALVLGLVNGLPGPSFELKLLLCIVLLGAMFIADHPALLAPTRHQRFQVILEMVIVDQRALRDELSRRLGGKVQQLLVLETDYVNEKMRIDVRLLTNPAKSDVPEDEIQTEDRRLPAGEAR